MVDVFIKKRKEIVLREVWERGVVFLNRKVEYLGSFY